MTHSLRTQQGLGTPQRRQIGGVDRTMTNGDTGHEDWRKSGTVRAAGLGGRAGRRGACARGLFVREGPTRARWQGHCGPTFDEQRGATAGGDVSVRENDEGVAAQGRVDQKETRLRRSCVESFGAENDPKTGLNDLA